MRTLKEIIPDGMSECEFSDRCFLDLDFFMVHVLGFQVKDFHSAMLNSPFRSKRILIKASRGFGKSTVMALVYPLWMLMYKPSCEIMFTASETRQAERLLRNVVDEIEDNEFLCELKPSIPDVWSSRQIKTSNGCKIWCRSFTKSLKGYHVDYCFVDEVQDIIDRVNYYDGVLHIVGNKNGVIVAVGTDNDPADMLNELYNKSEYYTLKIPILKKDGVPMWPEKYPIEKIQAIRHDAGESSFQRQCMLNPNASFEESIYSTEWVSNCYDNTVGFVSCKQHEGSSVFIGADFAISSAKWADFDAYTVVEKFGGFIRLLYAERHKGLPKDAKKERLRQLYKQYSANKIILDPANVGEGILQDLRMDGFIVESGEFHARARNKMLVNLVNMVQPDEKTGRSILQLPRNPDDLSCMTYTNILTSELIGFREVKSASTGMTSIQSSTAHDDTVMSMALACKAADESRVCGDMMAM